MVFAQRLSEKACHDREYVEITGCKTYLKTLLELEIKLLECFYAHSIT